MEDETTTETTRYLVQERCHGTMWRRPDFLDAESDFSTREEAEEMIAALLRSGSWVEGDLRVAVVAV